MPKSIPIREENQATFACPKCGRSKTVDIGDFLDLTGMVKVRYKFSCARASSIGRKGGAKPLCSSGTAILERRRYRRKTVSLRGAIRTGTGEKEVTLLDISKAGVRFSLSRQETLRTGERLDLTFHLDNRSRTRLRKEILVREVRGLFVGSEYCGFDENNINDRVIGYYLSA